MPDERRRRSARATPTRLAATVSLETAIYVATLNVPSNGTTQFGRVEPVGATTK